MGAAVYLSTVAWFGLPVALLAGLFVPLSLAAESAVRAVAPAPSDLRAEFARTGLGVLAGGVVTLAVVFAAAALGL